MKKINEETEKEQSFVRELVERVYPTFRKQALSRLNYDEDLADECLLAVLETALKKAHTVAHHPRPEAWLAKTLQYCIKRAVVSVMKSPEKRFTFIDIDTLSELLPDVHSLEPEDEQMTDDEIARHKEHILSELTEAELITYKMRYEDNLSTKEISERLDISEEAVRARIYRINVKLRLAIKNIFSQ